MSNNDDMKRMLETLADSEFGASAEDIAAAIENRIVRTHPNLFSEYGPEVTANAIMSVAEFHEGADELGSSDVSAMVDQVVQTLERDGEFMAQEIGQVSNPEMNIREDDVIEGRAERDSVAMEVKAIATEFFGNAPYSSARIAGGTVHRVSIPVNHHLEGRYRHSSLKDITPGDKQTLVKLRDNFFKKLNEAGIDTSLVEVKYHIGAGVYASIRTQLNTTSELPVTEDDIEVEKAGQGVAMSTKDSDDRLVFNKAEDAKEFMGMAESVFEEYNIKFEEMLSNQLNEDISVTQTSNADVPENNTITITGTGDDVDALGSMLRNAGIAAPVEQDLQGEEVYSEYEGMPVQEDANEMSIAGNLHKLAQVIKSVETKDQLATAKQYAELAFAKIRGDVNKTDSISKGYPRLMGIIDAIEADLANKEEELSESIVTEDDIKGLSPELGKALASGELDLYDVLANDQASPEDLAKLQADYNEISFERNLHPDDDFEQIMDIMMDYIQEQFGIEECYANSPDKVEAGVEAVTGSGNDLNRAKNSFRPTAGGDNPMALGEDDAGHTSFLNLYKAFQQR